MAVLKIATLSETAKKVVALLANGYAVKHHHHGLQRGGDVRLSGTIFVNESAMMEINADVMNEIKDAGVPLHTYEHNIAEGWKTIIPIQSREDVSRAMIN